MTIDLEDFRASMNEDELSILVQQNIDEIEEQIVSITNEADGKSSKPKSINDIDEYRLSKQRTQKQMTKYQCSQVTTISPILMLEILFPFTGLLTINITMAYIYL